MTDHEARDFYVGYLPLPAAHRRAMRFAIPALIVSVIAVGGVIAALQRDPGPAVWNTADEQTWTGTVIADPYPMLLDNVSGRLIPVVEMGKLGAQDRLAPLDAQRVELRGFELTRAGRTMIELLDSDEAIAPAGTASPLELTAGTEQVTLTGEILDAKCYLGAMKPGDGRAHKACAELCIAGGIPPMLFTRDQGGGGQPQPRHLIVATADGRSAAELVGGYLGEPVSITGRLARLADLEFLLIDDGAITRAP